MQNGMQEVTKSDRQPDGLLVLRTLTMPKDCNPNGDIFGGWILSQMDIGGGLLAKEVSRGRTVTVTIDKMTFVKPVGVGDTICVYAKVSRIGNTSMEIRLEVWAKNLMEEFEEQRHLVTEGVFKYVAIDEERRPRRIPDNPSFPRESLDG
jgi:acyl-CoA thioesterase YciA